MCRNVEHKFDSVNESLLLWAVLMHQEKGKNNNIFENQFRTTGIYPWAVALGLL